MRAGISLTLAAAALGATSIHWVGAIQLSALRIRALRVCALRIRALRKITEVLRKTWGDKGNYEQREQQRLLHDKFRILEFDNFKTSTFYSSSRMMGGCISFVRGVSVGSGLASLSSSAAERNLLLLLAFRTCYQRRPQITFASKAGKGRLRLEPNPQVQI